MPMFQELRCNRWGKFKTFTRFRDKDSARNHIDQIIARPSGEGWRRERLEVGPFTPNRLKYPGDKFVLDTVWEFVAYFVKSGRKIYHEKSNFWEVVRRELSRHYNPIIVLEQVPEGYLNIKFPANAIAQTSLTTFLEEDSV